MTKKAASRVRLPSVLILPTNKDLDYEKYIYIALTVYDSDIVLRTSERHYDRYL